MSPRPRIDHLRRPQLLAAAAEVIGERGFSETRTSDVAERAGVSAPNVLYYFESKDALLEQALQYNEDQYYDSVVPELARLEGPADKLVYFLESMAYPPEGPYGWTLWVETWARALHSPSVRDLADRDTRRIHDLVRDIVREGQESGEFDPGTDPDEFVLELCAMMDGLLVSVELKILDLTAERALQIGLHFASAALGCELTPSGPGRAGPKRQAAGS